MWIKYYRKIIIGPMRFGFQFTICASKVCFHYGCFEFVTQKLLKCWY